MLFSFSQVIHLIPARNFFKTLHSNINIIKTFTKRIKFDIIKTSNGSLDTIFITNINKCTRKGDIMAELNKENETSQSGYDEALAIEAERRRLARIAELKQLIAELQEKRNKYYEAQDLTIKTINELNSMSDELTTAVNDLHDCFQIGGVNADNGKIDAKIAEIEGYATTLNSQTLPDMNQEINSLNSKISTAVTELNNLVVAGESTFEDTSLRKTDAYAIVKSNAVETRATGNGSTFLDIDKLNNYFTMSMTNAQKKLASANSLIDSITQTVPTDFSGIGVLNSMTGNFDTLNTDLGKIYNNIFDRASKALNIENKGNKALSKISENLAKIKTSQGNKAVATKISSMVEKGTLNSTYLSLNVLPNLVRSGAISISDLSEITSTLYSNKTIGNAELGTTLYELRRTNLNYSATKSNIKAYEEKLNSMYGYDYEYEENYTNDKNSVWFKIKSEYTYKNSDINDILKPMYDNGLINTDDIREMTSPLTIFNKETGNPDVYNNEQYSPVTKKYGETNGLFQLTVGNRAYQVNDKDREFVKDLPAILHKDLLKILGIE